MLEKEINTIVELCNALQGKYESRLFEPVDEKVMEQWEHENKIMIPELYKEWLRFSNGALIRGTLAYFYGIEGFELGSSYYPEDCVIIGDLIGDGERLGFAKATGKIVRINHGRIREYDDFAVFLNRMVMRMLRG